MCCVRICLFHEVKKDNIIFSNNYIIMSISLDGHTSFIGTEFIKLLNTGSSDLATVAYVDEQVAQGGGGNVDLSNYYTQTETDNLLNAKLNVNNPQDILGNLRLDPTNGNSKIILNATSPPNNNDDFYCNGSAHINGTLRVSLLTSDGDLNADGVNADVFNSNVITNDIIFNHNDVEYMRFNATDDELQLSKNIELNEDLIMKSTKVLYLDATSNLLRYITTRNDNGQDILELVNNKATNNQIRFTNNGSTSMIVDNSFLFSERQIQGNNGLKVDFIDTRTASANFDFRRSGATAITLKADNEVQFSGYIFVNNISTPENTDLALRRSGTELIRFNSSNQIQLSGDLFLPTSNNQYIRFTNCNIRQGVAGDPAIVYFDFTNDTATGQYRFYIDTNTILHLRPLSTTISNTLQVNTINSNGNATLNIQQNGDSFISLFGNTLNRVQINRFLRVVDDGGSNQAQFVNNSNGNYMEFRLGNHINAYAAGTPVNGNTLHLNYYSHGNVMLGTNQDTSPDPIPTISINKFTSGTGNAFEVQGNSVFSGTVSTNTLNSESGDLTIQRDGTDVLNIFTYTPTNGPSIIVDAQSDCGISSSWLFANTFANRTGNTDTEFRGAISGGLSSGKVYMKYLHATETLDFDCVIDNTSQNIIGNIINTAVSDKRLKTNIQDIDANYSDCVKNVKLKTFEFKDEKYHNQDKYGMIAQDLLEHLPKEFKGIVRENKPKKDGDKEYLSIDYMKLSVVLWGCCQEQQGKIEHLEARLFELEDIVKDKKKSTPKSKAKAKS